MSCHGTAREIVALARGWLHAPMALLMWRSVLTVMVDGVSRLSGAATHGCLQLIDLAGMGTHDTQHVQQHARCVADIRLDGNISLLNAICSSSERASVCICVAGSERVSRSEATGERLKEAQHINRSLSALGSVMAVRAFGTLST